MKPAVDPGLGADAKYRAWGCPALASSKVPGKMSMLGLKISRSGELTAGPNEPFWWLIALTAKNVSLSQTVCALSLQQCMQLE